MRLLVITADPPVNNRVVFDREVRAIEQECPPGVDIVCKLACTSADAFRLIREVRADAVHFCLHGDSLGNFYFDDGRGRSIAQVATDVAAEMRFAGAARTVVYSVCWSSDAAHAALRAQPRLEGAVGIAGEVGPDTAAAFSSVFYRMWAGGGSFQAAFEAGKLAARHVGAADAELYVSADAGTAAGVGAPVHSVRIRVNRGKRVDLLQTGQTFALNGWSWPRGLVAKQLPSGAQRVLQAHGRGDGAIEIWCEPPARGPSAARNFVLNDGVAVAWRSGGITDEWGGVLTNTKGELVLRPERSRGPTIIYLFATAT